MSYDVTITDKNGEVLHCEEPHGCNGGTYCVNSTELWLNITSNYRKVFILPHVFGEKGLWTINGKSVKDAQPMLYKAIGVLGDDENSDYWVVTEGNVKKALIDLIHLLHLAPLDGIIRVTC